MHELLFICSSSVSEIFGITQLGFQTFYLLRDNYLLCFISFFFSSIDIVLVLAHVFSAFVELGYVNHDFLFLKCANNVHVSTECVSVCVSECE